jgi:yeast amino acid transporter
MASNETKKHQDIESIVPVQSVSHGNISPVDDTHNSKHGLFRPSTDGMRTTKRGLKSRHVQLMAIGGSIGTALFVGIGNSLSRAGPLSLLLGYIFWGLGFIWPCNLYTAEMVAYLPIKGQIFELASRYVDPAVGFALGWTYFFGGSMLVCVEHAAVAAVIQYWNTDINPAVWISISIVVCYTLNVAAVQWYGESEFIMASTKIILLAGLIMLTFITMVGGNPQHDVYGFRYWTGGLAMHPYYAAGVAGNFLGWWSCVRYAAFTIAGPDLITMAAGEMEDPRKTIPRVARLVFYRLVGFYIVGVLAVGIICSSRDTGLLGAIEDGGSGAGASPWVIGIQNLGITGLPSLINAVIMLSGLSCGNAYLYSTSRTLYSLAQDGQAPKFLLKCTKAGVPIYCVSIVTLLGCLTYLSASAGAVTVFFWFVNLTTIAFVAVYTTYLFVWTRWYAALKAQGISRDALPYKAPFAPYGAWFGVAAGCTCMFFIGFDVFSPWSTEGFVTYYFGLVYGLVMFVFWKVYKKTKWVVPAEADLVTGKAEVDEDCKRWESPEAREKEQQRLAEMSFFGRLWERMW